MLLNITKYKHPTLRQKVRGVNAEMHSSECVGSIIAGRRNCTRCGHFKVAVHPIKSYNFQFDRVYYVMYVAEYYILSLGVIW